MKKYEFEFNCGKDEVLQRLFMDVKKPVFFKEPALYGRISEI